MMKTFYTLCLLVLLIFACNTKKSDETEAETTEITVDTLQTTPPTVIEPTLKKYENQRFRQVTVEKVGENQFRIQGEGQIFEANLNWVVEDGHDELKSGFSSTKVAAPNWGKFDFTLNVEKERENSTLLLILFEINMENGSRRHELPIPLPL